MDGPVLLPGEELLAASPDVYVKSIRFTAFLTSTRIILRSAGSRTRDRELGCDAVESISCKKTPDGIPVLTVTARSRLGESRKLCLQFPGWAGCRGSGDGPAVWARHLAGPEGPAPPGGKVPCRDRQAAVREGIPWPGPDAAPEHPPGTLSPGYEAARRQMIREIDLSINGERMAPRTSPAPAAPLPAASGSAFCTRCGSRATGDSLFCARCGAAIVLPDEPGSPAVRLSRPDGDFGDFPARKSPAMPEAWEDRAPVRPGPGRITVPAAATRHRRMPSSPQPDPMVRDRGPAPVSRRRSAAALVSVAAVLLVLSVLLLAPGMAGAGNATQAFSIPALSGALLSAGSLPGSDTSQQPASKAFAGSGPVPSYGIYVRIAYSGSWEGTYGTTSSQVPVTGKGVMTYRVTDTQEPVVARIRKADTAKDELAVTVYCDGKLVKNGSTKDPAGSVSLSAEI